MDEIAEHRRLATEARDTAVKAVGIANGIRYGRLAKEHDEAACALEQQLALAPRAEDGGQAEREAFKRGTFLHSPPAPNDGVI